jgi:molecular chaperone GrpE
MNTHRPAADVNIDDPQEESALPEEQQASPGGEQKQTSPFGGDPADSAEQMQQLNDRVLRLQAELENVRKRASREAADARLYSSAPLLEDLLGVLDNMQRAVAAAKESSDAKNLVDGFAMVALLLQDVLARHGCAKIEALGQPFDPHRHEAIGQQPSGDQPPGTVLAVVQDGYQLHDRVLRPTRVIIAAAPAGNAPAGEAAQND